MKGNFKQLINSERPVLIDFYADWCGPCKTLSPILNEVSKELNGKVRIVKIDVDRNPAVAQSYQIRGVPTLMLFTKGKSVWRQSGVVGKRQIIDIINRHT